MSASPVLLEWFANAQDFDEIKAFIEDGDSLPATYAAWLVIAERGKRMFSRKGHAILVAYIVPDAFRQFCLTHGTKPNYKAMKQFAASILADKH